MFGELSLLAPILADIGWANTLIFWLNFIAVASWICFDNYFLCPAHMQVKSRLELGLCHHQRHQSHRLELRSSQSMPRICFGHF